MCILDDNIYNIIHSAKVEVSTTANGGIGTFNDEANELFATTFNNIKSFTAKSIRKFCDFTGKLLKLYISQV